MFLKENIKKMIISLSLITRIVLIEVPNCSHLLIFDYMIFFLHFHYHDNAHRKYNLMIWDMISWN